ncbi:MAG TPA: class I SAM-dependent methyltransferase [Thermoleophilaceae bacterium]|jgi:SAM-dependent methyltransferase
MTTALDIYARALGEPGERLMLRSAAGDVSPAAVSRWLGPVTEVDNRVLAGAVGPVLDVGCGPGRHVHALARSGVLALGVDVSAAAIELARRRGLPVIEQSIFARVPGAGSWRSALLLDGNIGIGGRPQALLSRLASLLAPGGLVFVELDPPGGGVRQVRLRLELGASASPWFDWAVVSADLIGEVAMASGFELAHIWCDEGRWFAQLSAR